MPRVDYEKLATGQRGDASAVSAEQVRQVREVQAQRFAETNIHLNAEMGPTEVREHAQWKLDEAAQSILSQAAMQMALSARAFHRVLKVARTVADFDGSDTITSAHVAEALQYRERAE